MIYFVAAYKSQENALWDIFQHALLQGIDTTTTTILLSRIKMHACLESILKSKFSNSRQYICTPNHGLPHIYILERNLGLLGHKYAH